MRVDLNKIELSIAHLWRMSISTDMQLELARNSFHKIKISASQYWYHTFTKRRIPVIKVQKGDDQNYRLMMPLLHECSIRGGSETSRMNVLLSFFFVTMWSRAHQISSYQSNNIFPKTVKLLAQGLHKTVAYIVISICIKVEDMYSKFFPESSKTCN